MTPESVVAVCRYCGTPNFVMGNSSKILAVPTPSSSEIVRRAVERTKRDFNLGRRMSEMNFGSPDLIYLPFYFVDVTLKAAYKATVAATYTRTAYVRGQPTTRVETRRVSAPGVASYSLRRGGRLGEEGGMGPVGGQTDVAFFQDGPRAQAAVSGALLAAELASERAKAKAVRTVMPRPLAKTEEDAATRAREWILTASATASATVDYTVERLEASPLTYLPCGLSWCPRGNLRDCLHIQADCGQDHGF